MRDYSRKVWISFTLTLFMTLSVASLEGGTAVVGTVAGGTNATIGQQALLPNTTLFSGDSLRVSKDGSAIVAMPKGSLVVLGRDTTASFERATDGVTVAITRGIVSMMHPADGSPLRVQVGPLSIVPGSGFKTQGDVAVVNDLVLVTAKEGSLRIEGGNHSAVVNKGKTIAIKNVAQGGQVGAAGAGAGISMHLVVPVATAAAAGAGATATAVATSKGNSAETDLAAAASANSTASTNSARAQTAAAAATASSQQQCKAASPSDPNCTAQ